MRNPLPAPDPVKHAELFAKSPKQLAAEIRQFVDEERQHVIENPECPGSHPFRCGHILALRFAQVFDEVPEPGELFLGYGQIVDAINTCPVTYLPALLMTIVERCEVQGVFQPGAIGRVVAASVQKVAHKMGTREVP